MGFVTFPREWEGLHEAFPACPTQFDDRSPLRPGFLVAALGAIGGLGWNSIRAIQRKPLGHAVLNGIGIFTIPLTAWFIISDEQQRASVKQDIQAILQADNISIPSRKFIKITSGSTPETNGIIGGALALSGLLLYKRAPNFPKLGLLTGLGAVSVGHLVGSSVTTMSNGKIHGLTLMKYKISCIKGAQIFEERTRKAPPPFLYGTLPGPAGQGAIQTPSADPWSGLRGNMNPDGTGSSIETGDESHALSQSHIATLPQPPGSQPHVAIVTEKGEMVFAPQRDYEWNPESAQVGLEILRDHLEDLNKARANNVKTAEYLWHTIARREAQNYSPYSRKNDSADVVMERKALELLTSIHKQVYSQIADVDWCIANTKKLMLQFQSDGKWMPNASGSVMAPEARKKILINVREHRKNLEVQEATIETSLKVMPIDDDEKAEIRLAISENLAATTKLLEDLEREAQED